MDEFTPEALLGLIEVMPPVPDFIQRTFYTQTDFIPDDKVRVDIVKGGRTVAPYVNPRLPAPQLGQDGYSTHVLTIPLVKLKDTISDADGLTRLPGEVIMGSGRNPVDRTMELVAKQLRKQRDNIYRSFELQATKSLLDGKCSIVGDGVNYDVDYQRDADNTIVLTGGDTWDNAGSKPITKLQTIGGDILLAKSGLFPDIVVGNRDAINLLLETTEFDKEVNKTGRNSAEFKWVQDSTLGVVFVTEVRGMKFFIYNDTYTDAAGNPQPFIPSNTVLLGSSRAECTRNFGVLFHRMAENAPPTAAMVELMPEVWQERDPGGQVVRSQSRPLMVPTRVDAFAKVTVK
jgi:hypothetical protein